MRAIPWPMNVEKRHDQPWPRIVSTHTTGRLNILGGHLRLAENDHESEAGDVEANGDHVGGERDVNSIPFVNAQREAAFCACDAVRTLSRSQLHDFIGDLSLCERPLAGCLTDTQAPVVPSQS